MTTPLSQKECLYKAVRTNSTAEALVLLKQNDDAQLDLMYVDPNNSAGWTPLLWTSYHGNEELVSKLIESDPAQLSCSPNNTALHIAAQRGNLSVCWILLLSSVDINSRDASDNTSLHSAAAGGYDSIVTLLIGFGFDVKAKNKFLLTPLEVCTDKKCRAILQDALLAQARDVSSSSQILSVMYAAKSSYLKDIVNGKRDGVDIIELEKSLGEFNEFGLPQHVIRLGVLRVAWLKRLKEIADATKVLQDASPITSASIYESTVNSLRKLIQGAETDMSGDVSNGAESAQGDPPTSIVGILQEARGACEIANAEYWLGKTLESCTASSNEEVSRELKSSRIADLEEAIQRANDLRGSTELITQASSAVARMKAELELQDALDNLPAVRLPAPEMTPKEEKTYWEARDIGKIEQFEGYPILPEGKEDYTWVESESLSTLRLALQRLDSAIAAAATSGVDDSTVENARSLLANKAKERDALEAKNDADRMDAVAGAKKTAMKLRKKKRKKKKAKA